MARAKPLMLDYKTPADLPTLFENTDRMFTELYADDGNATGASTLAALSDVSVAGVLDGQVLTYNGASALWKPVTPSSGGGGSLVTLTPPVDGQFSWANQGGASVTVTPGVCIYLLGPATSGSNLRMRVMNAPATPYTLTVACIPDVIAVNFCTCGVVWRDSVSGKVVTFGYGGTTPQGVSVSKFTSPTVFSATYASLSLQALGQYLWFQISDDGVNRISRLSFDGINFRQIHTIGRTDFLTANQIGIFADPNQTTGDSAMTLVSWKTS